MFEKIKEKWKKQADEVDKKDITYIKKYPNRWIGMMAGFILIYMGLMILVILYTTPPINVTIMIVLTFMVSLICVETICWDKYKKAFPK